jgi:alpha-D-ribose 1-methylphosphonate 5-triphosphate synthase subunit PhnL
MNANTSLLPSREGPGEGDQSTQLEMLKAENVGKTFILHLQHGLRLPVLEKITLTVHQGECIALTGPSGAGKSTFIRALHANYRVDAGKILVRHHGRFVDIAAADPRTILAVRRDTIGYVSQFLRTIPRVPTIDIVAEAATIRGAPQDEARESAKKLLLRLNIPARLHALPPATFSGGEQQRVNLARGFIAGHPILLLDEPTASLDRENAAIVVDMIAQAKSAGVAIVGIFHDREVREAVATASLIVSPLQDAA